MKIALILTTRVSSSPYPSRRCPVSKPRLPIFKLLSPPVKAGSARFGPDATRRSGHSFKLHMHSGLTRLVHQIRPSRFKRGTAPRWDPSNHGRRRQQITCSSVPQLCTAITTRLERGRFSSPPLLSCSGGTACFYLSSPAGSDASWPRHTQSYRRRRPTSCRNRPLSSASGRLSGSHHGRICPAQVSAVRACRWIQLDRGCLPAPAGPCIIMVPGRPP